MFGNTILFNKLLTLMRLLSFLARDKSYEMTSFVETGATTLLKQEPVEFVKYPLRLFFVLRQPEKKLF